MTPEEERELRLLRKVEALGDLLDAAKAIDAYWSDGNFSRQRSLWDPLREAIAKVEATLGKPD